MGELLPRVGRLRVAQDDNDFVVPNVVRDLLDGVTAKSREVLRFAQDDGGVVVPNVVRDFLDGVTAKSRETVNYQSAYPQQRLAVDEYYQTPGLT
ncbi:hypothetical protein [Legionella maceachernii]|uniref:hypothetical protein n=1 Tax=Legionella maceachernii TaxID=466 RepID=UPI000E000840|nr:hypothetical protein [Legionella maceachernii]SUP03792.1 Uncharacterised protein [Legionella maceachernii]